MSVVPRFAIGEGYAVYRGPTTTVTCIVTPPSRSPSPSEGEVAIVDASGVDHRAAALVVAPMARAPHARRADLLTYFVEPHCAFADRLRERHGAGISVAPELRDLGEDESRRRGRPSSDARSAAGARR